jgi:glycosyltransferase involved in cell wall biosynthesis
VLLTSPALFGEEGVFGGGERYAMELARAVAARLGGATLYAAGARDQERETGSEEPGAGDGQGAGNLRVVVRRPRALVRGQASNPLPRGLWAEVRRAEVVHCFQRHIALTTAAIGMARLARRPVFVTDLGGGGWDLSAYLDTSRWCAGLLHLSEYARRLSGRTAPSDRVLLGGARRSKGIRADDGTVLYVGRLLPHKGPDVLLEAAEPAWRVVVCGRAGDARYRADLSRFAEGKPVTFAEDADDDTVAALYRRAAVVVVPSRDVDRYGRRTAVAELLGLTAIEAAAHGVPVVASRIAALPEIVEDGVTGLLVPAGDAAALRDAVGALLADPARRAALGQAAAERAAGRFTWEATAGRAVEAYRAALR